MNYMLLYRETDEEIARGTDPAQSGEYWGAWTAYIGAMASAGVMVSGNGLAPPHTATLVSVQSGSRTIHDGPYPDTKEQLGGYVVIDVPDLDAALEWAARAPSALVASVEVRPVLDPPQG